MIKYRTIRFFATHTTTYTGRIDIDAAQTARAIIVSNSSSSSSSRKRKVNTQPINRPKTTGAHPNGDSRELIFLEQGERI